MKTKAISPAIIFHYLNVLAEMCQPDVNAYTTRTKKWGIYYWNIEDAVNTTAIRKEGETS